MSIVATSKITVGPRERYHTTPDRHYRRIQRHQQEHRLPGLLSLYMILSTRPPGWTWNSITDLAMALGAGRNVTRALLGHLGQLGYYQVTRSQDAAGKWSTVATFHPDGIPTAEPVDNPPPADRNVQSDRKPDSGLRSDQAVCSKPAGRTDDRISVLGPTCTSVENPQVAPKTGFRGLSITPDVSQESYSPAAPPPGEPAAPPATEEPLAECSVTSCTKPARVDGRCMRHFVPGWACRTPGCERPSRKVGGLCQPCTVVAPERELVGAVA